MKLVFALGNHESRYHRTRHNVGFEVLDTYAKKHQATWSEKTKFKAVMAEVSVHGEKVMLAKPTTYYNMAGESYRALCAFYDFSPEHTVIVHDELALPLGTIRTRIGGTDGGNNGIKSIRNHGGHDSLRIRIGIATELRERTADDAAFVLGKLTADETAILQRQQPTIDASIDAFIDDRFDVATHQAGE